MKTTTQEVGNTGFDWERESQKWSAEGLPYSEALELINALKTNDIEAWITVEGGFYGKRVSDGKVLCNSINRARG